MSAHSAGIRDLEGPHTEHDSEPDAENVTATHVVIQDMSLSANITSPEQLHGDGEPSDSAIADDDNSQQQQQPASSSRDLDSATTEALHRATQQLSSQYDSARMQTTPDERQHALAVKRAIEGTPDLDNLSDMMYAQLAILGEGNIEWSADSVLHGNAHAFEFVMVV